MYWSLLGFCAACFLAALSGALFRPGAWYRQLNKPSWQPPDWLFGPVWMVLYGMIAAAGWLVWREAGFAGATLALVLYAVQLVLNALWSALFFGLRRMDLALIEVGALWLSILATLVAFWPIDRTAALLMLPYLAWVSFAAFLNYTVLRLNPSERRLLGQRPGAS